MIINVIPQRLLRVEEELRQTERVLIYTGYSIEQIIESLKHSEDESMLLIASKLSKTLDRLMIRTKTTKLIITALDRIAAAYTRTEERVVSFEDEVNVTAYMRYKHMDISKVRTRAAQTFDVL